MLRTGLRHLWLQEPVLASVEPVLAEHRKTVVGSYDHRNQVVAVLGFCPHQIHSSIAKYCQFKIGIFPLKDLQLLRPYPQ